jgi:hypothetical protein
MRSLDRMICIASTKSAPYHLSKVNVTIPVRPHNSAIVGTALDDRPGEPCCNVRSRYSRIDSSEKQIRTPSGNTTLGLAVLRSVRDWPEPTFVSPDAEWRPDSEHGLASALLWRADRSATGRTPLADTAPGGLVFISRWAAACPSRTLVLLMPRN